MFFKSIFVHLFTDYPFYKLLLFQRTKQTMNSDEGKRTKKRASGRQYRQQKKKRESDEAKLGLALVDYLKKNASSKYLILFIGWIYAKLLNEINNQINPYYQMMLMLGHNNRKVSK